MAKIRQPGTLGFLIRGTPQIITETVFPRLFGENWMSSVGLPEKRIQEIIAAAIQLYKAGLSRDRAQIKGIRDLIANKLSMKDTLPISKILMYLEGITRSNFPAVFDAMTPKGMTSSTLKTMVSQDSESAVKAGKEFVADVWKDATDAVSKNLPWWAKPQILVGAGLVLIALYALTVSKGFLPRPKYLSNPVDKRDAAKKMYKKFHDAEPKKRYPIDHIDTEELTELGKVLELGYRSKKWTGNAQDYLHQFGKNVKLFCTTDGKALVISGGKMSIESQGIIN